MLALETKGQETEQDKVKQQYISEWIKAVNAQGGFEHWQSAVVNASGEINGILV